MKKINKKGSTLLPEETLKAIIAVICMVILFTLLINAYFLVTTSTKMEQAKRTLNGKEGIIAVINSGNNQLDHLIESPTKWYLFGFTVLVPDSCSRQSCICICEKTDFLANAVNSNAQLEMCGKKGVCSVVPALEQFEPIKIEKGKVTSISIIQSEGRIEIKKN